MIVSFFSFFPFVIVSIADADRNYKRAIRIDRLPNTDRYCEILWNIWKFWNLNDSNYMYEML